MEVAVLIAAMALLVAMANRYPQHLRSRCGLCGGHIHSKSCPWRRDDR